MIPPSSESQESPVSPDSEETKEDENAVQQEIDSPLRIVVRNAFIDIDESDMSGSAEPGSPAHVSSPPASTASRADPLVGFAGEAEGQSEGARKMDADQWTGMLPPEATGKWDVSEDVCSLSCGGADMKLPRLVYERLYEYQRQGAVWMWNLYQNCFGGILADEMGLGKTVQTAAFLACLKFTNQGARFLVVVPVTLLEQWRRELETWAQNTGLAVHVMHGAPHERGSAIRGLAARSGVLLISYDLVRTCIHQICTAGRTEASALPRKRKRTTRRGCRDDDSPTEEEVSGPDACPPDEQQPWDVIIVDEGHQIKNPSCQFGRALRRINARSRILLTGTPLQNKLGDLWALMDFVQPGLLGNHATFDRNFSEQIAKGSKRNASRFAVELKDHLARELKRLTAPHFLRRLKCEIAGSSRPAIPSELPPKTDVVLWLNLTSAQMELYNLFLTTELVCKARGGTKCGMEALRAIATLKKLCGHPLLCLPQDEYNQWRAQTLQGRIPDMPEPSKEVSDDVATQEAPECRELLPRLRALLPSPRPNSAQGAALLSTKLRVLSVLLPQLQKRGHRCLIFSQNVRMLDLIQGCVLRVLGLKFLRIDGSIDAKDRDLKLQKFQRDDSKYFALCLSLQVGGTGLTVTGANRVILVDPAWNPSADAQAIDRVHRIGQKQEVVVYRLIGSGAIEDKMFRLQIFKGGLSKTFMEQEQQVRFFTHKQLKSLFEPPNQSMSTQSLMAEQIGTEALEHEDLLRVVAADVGSTDDPQALAFWQSSDVLGFSDYQRLFMFLEHADTPEQEAAEQAKELAARQVHSAFGALLKRSRASLEGITTQGSRSIGLLCDLAGAGTYI
ncbi:unnamed protein product [Durusdinium trenchii]|uniref:DNA excision repair protein ERCC-6 n=1 Tax=Durusdinium trenchii TaxID=1381693 RepID=A0ABP0IUN5_9DINO